MHVPRKFRCDDATWAHAASRLFLAVPQKIELGHRDTGIEISWIMWWSWVNSQREESSEPACFCPTWKVVSCSGQPYLRRWCIGVCMVDCFSNLKFVRTFIGLTRNILDQPKEGFSTVRFVWITSISTCKKTYRRYVGLFYWKRFSPWTWVFRIMPVIQPLTLNVGCPTWRLRTSGRISSNTVRPLPTLEEKRP